MKIIRPERIRSAMPGDSGLVFLVGRPDALENLEPTLDPETQAMVGELGNNATRV